MAGGKENETKFGFMPPLMVRGGVERSETEGIRRSETEQTIPQSAYGSQLPLHKGAIKICKSGVPSLVMPFCLCERGTMDDGNITESPIT